MKFSVLPSIASPVGAFLSGLLMDRWGRRTTLILCTIPFMVSWLLLTFATKHVIILIARAMAGFASGLTIGPTQVLVGEISEPRIRGILTGTNFMSHSIGILLVYIMGAVMDWSIVSAISTVFPFLSLVAFVMLPESPVWLVRHNRVEEAEKALRWLRGGGMGLQARKELDQLISRFREEKEEMIRKRNSEHGKESSNRCCGTISKPQVFKPFIIVSVFYLVQVISGTYLVIFYAVEVITQAGGREGLGIDRFFAAVLTAADRLFFTFIMCFLLLRVGRRPLALVSGFLQAFASIALATFLYLKNGIKITDYEFPLCKYCIIVCMLLYVATNTCGYFSMPGIAMGELLPAKVRGSIGGYILACTYIGFFVTTKIFPWLCSVLAMHGVFAVFGIVGLVGTFFMYLFLPESSGKSLAEIENYFCQPNVLWVGRNRVLSKYNWRPEDFELQVRR
ncbi:Facilitated trehalose transporter Tret1 [Blattella germanica]|nr:Facilitated trehalose transporter Tret1 [Blattella germanica]